MTNIIGTSGNDTFSFTSQVDGGVYGLGGNDSITMGPGPFTFHAEGGAGNDTIMGGADDDLYGGAGNDQIYAMSPSQNPNDAVDNGFIDAGDGNDLIADAGGYDILIGGSGNDTILGGGGRRQPLRRLRHRLPLWR